MGSFGKQMCGFCCFFYWKNDVAANADTVHARTIITVVDNAQMQAQEIEFHFVTLSGTGKVLQTNTWFQITLLQRELSAGNALGYLLTLHRDRYTWWVHTVREWCILSAFFCTSTSLRLPVWTWQSPPCPQCPLLLPEWRIYLNEQPGILCPPLVPILMGSGWSLAFTNLGLWKVCSQWTAIRKSCFSFTS